MKKILIIYTIISCTIASDDRCKFVYEQLNNWVWPFRFFCKFYNSLPNYLGSKMALTKSDIIRPTTNYISVRIGKKQLLRYHNSWMSDEQFADWWMLCYGGKTDEQFNEYYTKYPIR